MIKLISEANKYQKEYQGLSTDILVYRVFIDEIIIYINEFSLPKIQFSSTF